MYKADTIAAVATPPGEGGIAIVRVSGPEAERIATEIFARSGGRNGRLRSHTLHHGVIRDASGAKLDEVLLALMRKPRSYTGEDVVEIHCHGGSVLVREVFELILSHGARHAEAGEFTKRAFLNGRLDLAQAEGVLDLIRARTDKGVRLALDQMSGQLSKQVEELRESLLEILVQVEAAIDFPEEEIELLRRPELAGKIDALRKQINVISGSYEWGRLFRDGVRVCICGRPNVGKSSLLNALLGKERVIVTPVPGTTRDVVEESINLGGLPVVLWDTAGIHETEDQVEKIGVGFSLKHVEDADAAMVVLDGSEPLSAEDRSLLASLGGKRYLVVINKVDLVQKLNVEELDISTERRAVVSISAKHGNGLEFLKQTLRRFLLGVEVEPSIVLTNARHKAALVRSEEALGNASMALLTLHPAEVVSVSLQQAREGLEEIIGVITNDDILERIFRDFCIGK